ncbi:MAG: RNA polymerase sigma factor, partial [Solirubrobacterales bacterium]|nr:RNA polymerase sigma factor [Solirubrobacterales bacterium]
MADDRRLVAAVRAGDDAAFEAIYDRHHVGLLGFCRHMLGSQPEAEDALQLVLLSAYDALHRDARAIDLKPWLYAIARNRCTSVLRARREERPLDDERRLSTVGLALADEVEQRDELKAVLGDVAELPDQQRAALVLAELGDLTHEEIGVSLGVPTAKVKALVFQARTSLIGSRQARDTPCELIREQLATLRGSALRRTEISRHLEQCAGCTAYREELRLQRAALGCVLPVAPLFALKHELLAGVLATGASGGAAAAGVATG